MNKPTKPRRSSQVAPVVSRTLLAVLGGYGFTYAFTAALSRALPLPRVDAVVIASLLSFIVYLIFVLWAFACASARRVVVVLATTLPLAVLGFWPQWLEWMR
ncbi:iron transporter [Stutzerimonas frequens]|uniref:Iron transporter n=1 Tax=Stutzerimonas frequens TaxID=2968969 RepID=A0AA47E4P8_9GAMM|nr:iron transporter [Stutzerimonas frequens]WAE54107.1 iron transporter [Stutzerimonas frequens]